MKKRVLSLALAIVLCIGMMPLAAYAADPGTTMNNPISIIFGQSYSTSWSKYNDHLVLYNKLTVTETGILEISFSKPYDDEGEYGKLELALYDSDVETVWDTRSYYSVDTASPNHIFHIGLTPGTYYMMVKPSFTVTSGVISSNYIYNFTATQYCETEPNDSLLSATPLNMNHLYTGYMGDTRTSDEYDYYKINLSAGSTYHIAGDWQKVSSTSLIAQVISPSGKQSYNLTNYSNLVSPSGYQYMEYQAPQTGTYYIKVYNYGQLQRSYKVGVMLGSHVCSYGAPEIITPATCTTDGLQKRTCAECGNEITETIPALGHSWNAGETVVVPSELQDGVLRKTCTRCGATKDEVIPSNPFTDVKGSDYCLTPVKWAYYHGVTTGTTATTFGPTDPCTRGQVVTFLWRAMGSPEPTSSNNPFSDVKPGGYYLKAVLWAVENGITKGTGATTFSPDQPCTRAQVVTFLYRTHSQPDVSGSCSFNDVSSSNYYYTPVIWAVQQKITTGTSSTSFSPEDSCTRGQIVTFLYRDLAA